ncbi:hypothetical protein FKM82_024117 [Ascaphus truei]
MLYVTGYCRLQRKQRNHTTVSSNKYNQASNKDWAIFVWLDYTPVHQQARFSGYCHFSTGGSTSGLVEC